MTMRNAIAVVIWLLVLFDQSVSGRAADINLVKSRFGSYIIVLDGKIQSGDSRKFEALLDAGDNPDIVKLVSPGGDVGAAIEIGRLIRKRWLHTSTPGIRLANGDVRCLGGPPAYDSFDPSKGRFLTFKNVADCACASACFLVWASGVTRSGSDAVIGLHRPIFASELSDTISSPQTQTTYTEITNQLRDYLHEMNIPDKYFDVMMNNNSREMYWMSEAEVMELSLSPLAEEYIISKCGEPVGEPEEYYNFLSLLAAHQRDPSVPRLTGFQMFMLDYGKNPCGFRAMHDLRQKIARQK